MPEWFQSLMFGAYGAFRQVIRSRSIFATLSDLGLFISNAREGFVREHGDYYKVEVDERGNKYTAMEGDLEEKEKSASITTRIKNGFKKALDLFTSPGASRVLFFAGAAVGIGLAASNPVTLGIAVAGAALSIGSVCYNMYRDVKKFRELRKLKEEQALAQEILLLKSQGKALAENLFLNNPTLLMQLGLLKKGEKQEINQEWLSQNKAKIVGRSFIDGIPSALVPLIASAASGNIAGFGITLAGYFLEASGVSAGSVAYAKHKELLLNTNISLLQQLGLPYVGLGQRNEMLRDLLAEMRAKNNSLIALSKEVPQPKNNSEAVKLYLEHHAKQREKIKDLTPESNDKSWWQDAKKVLFKDTFSFAKAFKNFNPVLNEYRDSYKTNKTSMYDSKSNFNEKEIKLEQQKTKQTVKSYSESVGSKIDSHNKITFDDKLKLKVTSFERQMNNKDYTALAKAVAQGESKEKILELYAAFKDSILPKGKDREDLTLAERNALKHANMVKFAAEKSSFVERENDKNKAKDSSRPPNMIGG